MPNTLKIALIIILLIYLFVISKSVKRKNMRINYLIFWSITGIFLIIALLAPNFVETISNFLGFELIPKPTATAHTTIARTPPLLLNADTKLFGTALIRINNGLLALLPVAASRPVSTDLNKPAL